MIVPKLEYAGEIWEGNNNFIKQLAKVPQMTAAKKVLFSRIIPKKKVPAIADRAVWEKVTKG